MIQKLGKKLKLSENEIRDICAQEHLLKYVHTKKSLKTINITFKGDTLKHISKIAKALKVSHSAVIGGLLYNRLPEMKRQREEKDMLNGDKCL
jgi:hypothetical protein